MRLTFGLCLASIFGFGVMAHADVMDEYRDPAFTGGYVVNEYLFDKTDEADQKSYAIYGEYDVAEYMTIYARTQFARIKPLSTDQGVDQETDVDHIAAIGSRLRNRFGEDGQHEIGVLVTMAHRDFNEINGETYRVMPYAYLFSGQTFSARAHIEFDFIGEDAWAASKETARTRSEEREVGLYLRANLTDLAGMANPRFKPDRWSISYEDKLASNLDEDNWGISHEHTLSFDHSNGWSVIVAQQKVSPEDTANINPFSKVTKDGYTTLSLKRQF